MQELEQRHLASQSGEELDPLSSGSDSDAAINSHRSGGSSSGADIAFDADVQADAEGGVNSAKPGRGAAKLNSSLLRMYGRPATPTSSAISSRDRC